MATTNGHPETPPASDPSAKPESQSQPQPQTINPEVPLTSLQDDGQTKRPRDARLIHAVLSNLGIHSYQERVPLQLLDFAYRYTSGVLNDSMRLSSEGYTTQAERGGGRRGGAGAAGGDDSSNITVTALRQAIASRQGYTFQGALPKEFMLDHAAERNRTQLPRVERGYGVQLPPEQYCLTGVGWTLKDEWESQEDEAPAGEETVDRQALGSQKEDERMGGTEGLGEEDGEDEEGAGRMEDVFGEEGGDTTMAD